MKLHCKLIITWHFLSTGTRNAYFTNMSSTGSTRTYMFFRYRYAMMLQCWNENPDARPYFGDIVLRLQRMLEDSQVMTFTKIINVILYVYMFIVTNLFMRISTCFTGIHESWCKRGESLCWNQVTLDYYQIYHYSRCSTSRLSHE
jgi:hypothetical protein